MSVNVRELMDLVIIDAQSLLDELVQDDLTRQYAERMLSASQFIRDEMDLYMSVDGRVDQGVIAKGRYAAAPFAHIETNVYLANKLAASGRISLSANQLLQLEQMKIKVFKVREQLDEIWGVENQHDSTHGKSFDGNQ